MIYTLTMATSQRKYGSMGLLKGMSKKQEEDVRENRENFFKMLGIGPERVVQARIVHGTKIRNVDAVPASGVIPRSDGLITNVPNIFLAIITADCFPLFLADSSKHAVGIAHVGWRGVRKYIVSEIVNALKNYFGTDPKNIKVFLGPGIRQCHFEVKEDVLDHFTQEQYTPHIQIRAGVVYINLAGIIKEQLLSCGISCDAIEEDTTCTYGNDLRYFSYRRNTHTPGDHGQMISVIGFRKEEA